MFNALPLFSQLWPERWIDCFRWFAGFTFLFIHRRCIIAWFRRFSTNWIARCCWHEHVPQRLRAQGAPLRFSYRCDIFLRVRKNCRKPPRNLARRFGVRILEGYGATECSPLRQREHAAHSRTLAPLDDLLPGIEYRWNRWKVCRRRATFRARPEHHARLFESRCERQFQALGGWYDTGDIVRVDEDGFCIFLVG